jgi:hypothetical protein
VSTSRRGTGVNFSACRLFERKLTDSAIYGKLIVYTAWFLRCSQLLRRSGPPAIPARMSFQENSIQAAKT